MPWTLGKTPDSYELPRLVITSTGTPWLADAAVASLTLDRELVSSVIPGNIRSDNGLSVGAAQVKIGFATGRATPWSRDRTRRVETGAPARLLARDSAGNEKDLGAWLIDPSSGSLDDGEVSVDLIEPQSAAKKVTQKLPPYMIDPFTPTAPLDPIWVVSRLAEQVGYNGVPRPIVGTTILSVPMDGGVNASYNDPPRTYNPSGDIKGWQVLPGDLVVGTANQSGISISANSTVGMPINDLLSSGQAVYITLNVVGTIYLHDLFQGWALCVVNDPSTNTYTISTSNNTGAYGDPQTYTPGGSANWTRRVQIELKRVIQGTTWGRTTARIRSGPDAAWSAVSTATSSFVPLSQDYELIQVVGGVQIAGTGMPASPAPGQFAGLQINRTAVLGVFEQRRALLKPVGGDAGLPWLPPETDVWTAIRDCLSARSAAAVLDPDGSGGSILRVLNRDDLAGVGIAGEPVDLGAEWTDLPWTLDPADSADRLQISYSVPQIVSRVVGSSTLAPAAWEASEVIRVNGGETITINAAFDSRAAVGVFERFVIPTTPNALWSASSTIIAFPNPDGTGTVLGPEQMYVRATQTSATTATVTVTNRTAAPMYLVDGNGNPHLVLRAITVATFDTQQSVSRGLSVDTAVNPLELDLSPWVQSKKDADSVADYLWSRISGGGLWSASSVECRLDWSHNIGRILRVTHPGSGLDFKMLTSKVALSADNGEISQALDVVILPWTWADFDTIWAASTWSAFDAVWAGSTWSYFDTDPLKNGA